ATGLIFGLGGTALGAYSETRIVNWHKFQMWALVFSICSAFFAYVIGGWTAGKILGARRAEHAVLHGALPGSSPFRSCSSSLRWGPRAISVSGTEDWPARPPGSRPSLPSTLRPPSSRVTALSAP